MAHKTPRNVVYSSFLMCSCTGSSLSSVWAPRKSNFVIILMFPLTDQGDLPQGIFNGIWLIFLRWQTFRGFCFRKNALTFFWNRIFGQDFFLTYALCDFLSTEHVFESIPAIRKGPARYLVGGGPNERLAPPPCGDLWLRALIIPTDSVGINQCH